MKTPTFRWRLLASLGATWLAAALACTGASAAPDAAFAAAYRQFDATTAELGATEMAAAFEALFKAEPDNPVLMAYLGASIVLRAQGRCCLG